MVHWTKAEDEYLIENFSKGVPVLQIARELSKTRSAAYHRVCKLGKSDPRRKNPVTTDQDIIKAVLIMYEQGYRYRDIVKKLNISKDNVSSIITQHVPVKRSKRKIIGMRIYPDELVEKVRILFVKNKIPAKQVAKQLDVRYHVVRDICCAHGFRRSIKWTKEQILTMIELLNKNRSLQDIGKELGRTPRAIWAKCNAMKIDKNYPSLCNQISKRISSTEPEPFVKEKISACEKADRIKGRMCDLTLDYVLDLYKKQNGKCFYTGSVLNFNSYDNGALSIDRVDSSIGHIKGNVVLCRVDVNRMKQTSSVNEFVNLASLIHAHKNSIKENLPVFTSIKASVPVEPFPAELEPLLPPPAQLRA